MLKRLQHKFMAIAMFALATLLFVQMFAVNLVNIYQRDSDCKYILQLIADNNGNLPNSYINNSDLFEGFFNPFGKYEDNTETAYSTRYFVVEMRRNIAVRINTDHISSVDDKLAFNYAAQIYGTEPGFGFIDRYRYYYLRQGEKSLFVFLDFQKEIDAASTLASISLLVSIITIVFILIPVYWLSKWAMEPVAQSIEKQKQFITDAGHELKTPLAIISADAEVLEICEGENEWLTSIKNQTVRMNELVKNLVKLSKLEEMNKDNVKTSFNISEAVTETALGFETTATMHLRSFELKVTPDLRYYGNEPEIRQLVSILCDNATKYTNEGGSITLYLYKSGKNIMLEIRNTCEYVDPASVSRLFDRFYRADSSRSRETGGYGIGLSVAKAIVDSHGGKIKALVEGTTAITFKVTL
ncbi:MAG: GHKL domain-containing protein [Clostridia bacterium]|nr:GHKL domain-containing protein [Clostridia bacterium]